jgi:23S rRNA (guanosine2251-2'-O)-methyltransferase
MAGNVIVFKIYISDSDFIAAADVVPNNIPILSIVACTEKGAESIFETSFTGPLALVMGSEEDGISEFLLRKAHHIAQLPQVGKIGSLNVSVAAGIAMYEALRQRLAEKL